MPSPFLLLSPNLLFRTPLPLRTPLCILYIFCLSSSGQQICLFLFPIPSLPPLSCFLFLFPLFSVVSHLHLPSFFLVASLHLQITCLSHWEGLKSLGSFHYNDILDKRESFAVILFFFLFNYYFRLHVLQWMLQKRLHNKNFWVLQPWKTNKWNELFIPSYLPNVHLRFYLLSISFHRYCYDLAYPFFFYIQGQI